MTNTPCGIGGDAIAGHSAQQPRKPDLRSWFGDSHPANHIDVASWRQNPFLSAVPKSPKSMTRLWSINGASGHPTPGVFVWPKYASAKWAVAFRGGYKQLNRKHRCCVLRNNPAGLLISCNPLASIEKYRFHFGRAKRFFKGTQHQKEWGSIPFKLQHHVDHVQAIAGRQYYRL